MLDLRFRGRYWSDVPSCESEQRDGLLSCRAEGRERDDILALKTQRTQRRLVGGRQRVVVTTIDATDVAYQLSRSSQAGLLGHRPHLVLTSAHQPKKHAHW